LCTKTGLLDNKEEDDDWVIEEELNVDLSLPIITLDQPIFEACFSTADLSAINSGVSQEATHVFLFSWQIQPLSSYVGLYPFAVPLVWHPVICHYRAAV